MRYWSSFYNAASNRACTYAGPLTPLPAERLIALYCADNTKPYGSFIEPFNVPVAPWCPLPLICRVLHGRHVLTVVTYLLERYVHKNVRTGDTQNMFKHTLCAYKRVGCLYKCVVSRNKLVASRLQLSTIYPVEHQLQVTSLPLAVPVPLRASSVKAWHTPCAVVMCDSRT